MCDGSYFVRESSTARDTYSLDVIHEGYVKSFRIVYTEVVGFRFELAPLNGDGLESCTTLDECLQRFTHPAGIRLLHPGGKSGSDEAHQDSLLQRQGAVRWTLPARDCLQRTAPLQVSGSINPERLAVDAWLKICIGRAQAAECLRNAGFMDGSYVVRIADSGCDNIGLSIVVKDQIYHMRIMHEATPSGQ